jgi:hypothetical protein
MLTYGDGGSSIIPMLALQVLIVKTRACNAQGTLFGKKQNPGSKIFIDERSAGDS